MLRSILIRLRAFALRGRTDRELDEELRFHVDAEVERNVARGMSPGDARTAARRAFGNVTMASESARDAWRWRWLEDLRQDVHYAARSLRQSPVLATVASLSLAIGIAANASVFSILDSFFLQSLPVREPGQLVYLRARTPPSRVVDEFQSEAFTRFRNETPSFAAMAAVNLLDRSNVTVSGPGGGTDPARARVALVSGDYFRLMGVGAALGRTFGGNDDQVQGAHPVAVISDAFWRLRLARAPDVLNRTLTLNGTAFAIVGVMPRGFSGEWVGRPVDFWVPTMMQSQVMIEEPGLITHRNAYWLRILARLEPGATAAQAAAETNVAYQRMLSDWSAPNPSLATLQLRAQQRITLEPAARGYSPQRETLSRPVAILTMVAGLVLLVACANVASLLVARGAARQREMAVRLALGAGRWRLVRQTLTESLVLASISGVLAIILAIWGTSALATSMATAPVQMFWAMSSWISFDFHVGVRVLAITGTLCLLAGVLFGMAPALRAPRVALAPSLASRGPASRAGTGRFALGKGLVVTQVALSLTVLVSAGLLVRTIRNLGSEDLGFRRDKLLLVWTQPSATGRDAAGIRRLWHDVQARLAALPGVVSASALNGGVLNGARSSPRPESDAFMIPGQPPRPSTYPGSRTFILPRFFETMGVPLIAGREFTDADTDTTSHVIVINETMAHHYFDERDPVGRRIGLAGDSVARYQIVGVARDFERGTPRAVGQRMLLWYLPYRDRDATGNLVIMCAVVRVSGATDAMAGAIRGALGDLEPRLPILKIDTVDEQLRDVLATDRLVAGLTAIFGVVTVLLACLGLYGVIAYTTSRRTNEIGIRMSLGATSRRVLGLVLRESIWLVLAGIAIGVPLALASGRLLQARLYGVASTDTATICGAAVLMAAVAALAGFVPARRAAAVNPIVALRHE